MATLADIERSRVARDGWPLLAERYGAWPRRHQDVGDDWRNLAYAEAASDRPRPPVSRRGGARGRPGGERALPIARFFRASMKRPSTGRDRHGRPRSACTEGRAHRLHQVHVALAEDRPLVGVAALIVLDEAGRCREARIARRRRPRRSAPAAPRPRFAERR